MSSILDGATNRRPFAGEGGRSGVTFESATLADGTPVVIKHSSTTDWLAQVQGGAPGLPSVWDAGIFERIPDALEHTMLAVEPRDGGFIVVMRDVSETLLGDHRVLSRVENRRVLEALTALHNEFWDEDVPGCPLHNHYAGITPEVSRQFLDLPSPIPPLIIRGWDMFADVAPPDIARVMQTILDDPRSLTDELAKGPSTLIHGDARLHNMGLRPEGVVLFDWEVTGPGVPSMDFSWYLIMSATRIDATRDQVVDDFVDVSGERFDARGLEIGLIGALTRLGWNKAIDILENPDPAIRAQERADLDWWIARVRTALEEWSPL